jgi:hypothetical protein
MPDFGESANDRDKLVAALRRATDDGANSTEDVADAILAEFLPEHDERVKAEAEAKLDAVREYARTEDFYVHDQNEAHKNGVRAVYAQPLEAILDRRES